MAEQRDPGSAPEPEPPTLLWVWRHPRPEGAAGRCIGRTDLQADPRRAKRLARQIQKLARVERLPRVVITSALQRCANVGRWLRRWGWVHHVDAALLELDFGRWDGLAWREIAKQDIDAWCEHFAQHAPGGGESVAQLLARVRAWQAPPDRGCVIVAHAGWMLARR